MFVGYTFASGLYSLDTTPTLSATERYLHITNGAFDELHITRNVDAPYTTEIPQMWDYDTVFHAYFNGNLSAGNTDYSIENTDAIRIKRREKDSFNWVTLYEKRIYEIDDFYFEYFDYTARSNTDYEYALSPLFGTGEGDFVINQIRTKFTGLFIMERDKFFTTRIVIEKNTQEQNKPIATVNTLGSRYPYIIANGNNRYKSGNVSAIFARFDEDKCEYDFENSWKYREKLNEFLHNNVPKLLKYDDGRMWLMCLSGNVSETEKSHELAIMTSFSWTEIGDCDSGDDLFYNGFIDFKDGVGIMYAEIP